MKEDLFKIKFVEWSNAIQEFNAKLQPIATRKIDINDPQWQEKLKTSPHPLVQAHIDSETWALLESILSHYNSCNEQQRQSMRELFSQHQFFSWAATIPSSPYSAEIFRKQLLLFPIKDQGYDTRDAIVALDMLTQKAREHGIDPYPIFQEVTELSSAENKYGMGSTKDLLRSR